MWLVLLRTGDTKLEKLIKSWCLHACVHVCVCVYANKRKRSFNCKENSIIIVWDKNSLRYIIHLWSFCTFSFVFNPMWYYWEKKICAEEHSFGFEISLRRGKTDKISYNWSRLVFFSKFIQNEFISCISLSRHITLRIARKLWDRERMIWRFYCFSWCAVFHSLNNIMRHTYWTCSKYIML